MFVSLFHDDKPSLGNLQLHNPVSSFQSKTRKLYYNLAERSQHLLYKE
jgi:hypothetical protein